MAWSRSARTGAKPPPSCEEEDQNPARIGQENNGISLHGDRTGENCTGRNQPSREGSMIGGLVPAEGFRSHYYTYIHTRFEFEMYRASKEEGIQKR